MIMMGGGTGFPAQAVVAVRGIRFVRCLRGNIAAAGGRRKEEGKRRSGAGAGRRMRRASAPLYVSAPILPGIVYPRGIESEGIPVPPPVARRIGAGGGGSGTPRSGYGRGLGRRTYTMMTPRASPHPPLTHTPGTTASSKHSLRMSKSHKHFAKGGYLDVASLSAEDVSTSEVVGRFRW
jgi:hypothetical protein